MSCWEIMLNRYVDKKAMWFNSMQVKCAWFNSMQVKCTWEHGPCANVCILDHDVTKYKTEYDLVKVPTWNFPQNLDRETTVKKPVNGREKTMKSHQKLAPNVYSFLGYFVVFSRVFHWNLWNHWSCQAVLALIDLKLVDEQLLLLRLWSVCGAWWVSPYICQHISQDGQDHHNHYLNLYNYHGFSMVFDGLEVTAGC